jgi:hypothetical protein
MARDSDSAALSLSPYPAPVADRRASFAHRLDERLRKHGIALVSANLGSRDGASVWVLAVKLRTRRIATLDAAVPEKLDDAFSDEACSALCERIVRWAGTSST